MTINPIEQFKKTLYSNSNQSTKISSRIDILESSRYIDIPFYLTNNRSFEFGKHFTILSTRDWQTNELIELISQNINNDSRSTNITALRPTQNYISTSEIDGIEQISIFSHWYDVTNFLITSQLLNKRLIKDFNSVNYCGKCFDQVEENLEYNVKEMLNNSLTIIGNEKINKIMKINGKLNPQFEMELKYFKLKNSNDCVLILKNNELELEKIVEILRYNNNNTNYNKFNFFHTQQIHQYCFKLFVGDLIYMNYKKNLENQIKLKKQYHHIIKQKYNEPTDVLNSGETKFSGINKQYNEINEYKNTKSLKPLEKTFTGLNYQIHDSIYKSEGFITISTRKPTIKELEKLYTKIQNPIPILKYNFLIDNIPITHSLLKLNDDVNQANNAIFEILAQCLKYEIIQGCESCLYPLNNSKTDNELKQECLNYLQNYQYLNNSVMHLNIKNSIYLMKPILMEFMMTLIKQDKIKQHVENFDLYEFKLNNELPIDANNISDDESIDGPKPIDLLIVLIPAKAKTSPTEALDILQVTNDEFEDIENCESYIKSQRLMKHEWVHQYSEVQSHSSKL
ncbi:hypothetical protein BN7_2417 [Wickerhamomyces ciferrii]|uniref:Uncharacterized protein n=1 Tax=Wickerhamomyces ciferrii (strain ATCC 14091 / BCRC 22168 / CBS 111 / JCM 3599 / NBRC 0793 / NRRL Y-1031 F-60-10) TaxID=1206466 RepID=K0KL25_WICCF|nr:uncharacterized protein BN7_2417 [Wickerhamomyces ciferrii]CCH42872.1 hypothetical protein BN7_2417 [Wickerhamomyces ciferrii]